MILTATAAMAIGLQTKFTESLVDYKVGDTTCEAFRATPVTKKVHPTVYIVHDWDGLNDHEKLTARKLAEMGYDAIAIDVYGKGNRPKTPQENSAEAGKYYSNPTLFIERLQGAVTAFDKGQKQVAIGYCFGGLAVIEMARNGMRLEGVASFHGGLRRLSGKLGATCSVAVYHGGADASVPTTDVQALTEEMSKTNFQIASYPGAPHGFCVKGPRYNANADEQSWINFSEWLSQVTKKNRNP